MNSSLIVIGEETRLVVLLQMPPIGPGVPTAGGVGVVVLAGCVCCCIFFLFTFLSLALRFWNQIFTCKDKIEKMVEVRQEKPGKKKEMAMSAHHEFVKAKAIDGGG